jgi:predicted metal-dependent phosphoesterase TrpH
VDSGAVGVTEDALSRGRVRPDGGFAVQRPVKLDLHNHTSFSADGAMSPAELLRAARASGLGYVAVTDHNSVEGALQAAALADADPSLPRVIPGIEISTADGDVIALYVLRPIPAGLPARETMALIREQGGLVYLPHPYDMLRRGTITSRVREEAGHEADIVEVLNGRALTPFSIRNSQRLALRHGKARGAGSDAHRAAEVGWAYVAVDGQPTRDDLVALVAAGQIGAGLRWHEYLLNWALQPLSAMTRFGRNHGRALFRR